MRTAMHSWSFRNRFREDPDFTIEQALEITAELGFTGIEIMAGKAGCGAGDFASDDPAYLQTVKRHAESLGIHIDSLATYNDFAYTPDEEWRLANIEYIKTWLVIAADLGVPQIRMLTGYYQKENPDPRREEELTLAGIAECVPVAERCGTKMAIENHNTIFFQAEDILGLIDRFGDCITACPDPSNWGGKEFWEPGCPADIREHVFSSAAKLAPKATQSHLKIKGITDDGKLVGFGDDLDRLIQSYAAAGYTGALAFESIVDGDLIAPLKDAKAIVDAAIARNS